VNTKKRDDCWRQTGTNATFNNPFYVNSVIRNTKPKRYGFKYKRILFSAVGFDLTELSFKFNWIWQRNLLVRGSVSFVRNLRRIFNRTDYTYMAANGRTIVGGMWREVVVAYSYSTTNKMHLLSRLIYACKTLYMFGTVFPSIIRSSKLRIQQRYMSNICCYLLLAAGSSSSLTYAVAVYAVLSSWWWTGRPSETYRAFYKNK